MFEIRNPCVHCSSTEGVIRQAGGQDVVFCADCGRYQYNAPKVETGKKTRSVSTTHALITPKIRARVLLRASGRCELCGEGPPEKNLHVGHILDVDSGMKANLTEVILNSDENLAVMCEECNLGLGPEPFPLRLVLAILKRRTDDQS